MWRGSHYRTRDGVIPFGLFWIYTYAMVAVHALERVQATRATSTAIGMAFAKDRSQLPAALRDELRDAFLGD